MTNERQHEARFTMRLGGPMGREDEEQFDFVKAMEETRRTGRWTLPFPWHCQVCGKEVRNVRTLPFCRLHRREFRERREHGVLTEALSHQWDDTLAVWNDRPDVLRQEPDSELFEFRWPEEDWLLFERGYSTRMPDWIVVHRRTREIRRFVNAGQEEVLEELGGGLPVPGQEELAQVWGTEPESLSIPLRVKEMVDAVQRLALAPPNLAEDIGTLAFPVYGITEAFKGLTFSSYGLGGGMRGWESINLDYGSEMNQPPIGWIQTRARRFRATGDLEDEAWYARTAAEDLWRRLEPPEEVERRFRENGPDKWLQQLGEGHPGALKVSLASVPSSGTVFRWSSDPEVRACVMTNESSIVIIGTAGLSEGEFKELMSHIGTLNDRGDVLSEHQAVLNARFEAIRRHYTKEGQ